MEVVDPDGDLLVVTEKGYGKRTPLRQYPARGRGTGGVITLAQDKLDTTGPIASARVVGEGDDLTVITSGGNVLRTKVNQIKQAGRATMGVRLIDLKEGEMVASVARIAAMELQQAGAEEEVASA